MWCVIFQVCNNNLPFKFHIYRHSQMISPIAIIKVDLINKSFMMLCYCMLLSCFAINVSTINWCRDQLCSPVLATSTRVVMSQCPILYVEIELKQHYIFVCNKKYFLSLLDRPVPIHISTNYGISKKYFWVIDILALQTPIFQIEKVF